MFVFSIVAVAFATPFTVQMKELLETPELRHADIGISVRRLTDASAVYLHQHDKTFIPASTLKWITAMAVADSIGLEEQLTTSVYVQGSKEGSTLKGNIIIEGGADPDLNYDHIESLSREIYIKAGIRKVEGSVLVDDSLFAEEGLGAGWSWDDLSYRYGAPYSALSINQNTTKVVFRGGKTVRWNIEELKGCFELEAEESSDEDVFVERVLGKNTIKAGGPIYDLKKTASAHVSLLSPADCTQTVLSQGLKKRGIKIKNNEMSLSGAKELVVAHHSPSVAQLLDTMLKWSQNLYAENLTVLLDPASSQKKLSNATKVVAQLLQRAKIEQESYRIVDGSGLSRYNLLTPDVLSRMSIWLKDQPYGQKLKEMLPVAGVSGTLAKRMNKGPLYQNVRAKTGSMSNVHNLTGFVKSADGQELVVTIFVNGHVGSSAKSKAFQEQVLEKLAGLNVSKELVLRERWWTRMKKKLIKKLSVGL